MRSGSIRGNGTGWVLRSPRLRPVSQILTGPDEEWVDSWQRHRVGAAVTAVAAGQPAGGAAAVVGGAAGAPPVPCAIFVFVAE